MGMFAAKGGKLGFGAARTVLGGLQSRCLDGKPLLGSLQWRLHVPMELLVLRLALLQGGVFAVQRGLGLLGGRERHDKIFYPPQRRAVRMLRDKRPRGIGRPRQHRV